MTLFLLLFLSPLVMAVVAAVLYAYARIKHLPKLNVYYLAGRSLRYGLIGAGISLLLTIIAMVWYEHSTGYSAGNGPLGWLFIYGPVSAALGQLVALIQWWFKKIPTLEDRK